MRWRALVVLVLVLAAACQRPSVQNDMSSAGPSPIPSPASSVSFGYAKVLIDTDQGSVIVDARKAETPEQRSQGLMFRESLGEDEGMVFLFFEEVTSAFHMKNTLIPLSIAFFDKEGTIVQIFDMEPCEEDPCPVYQPDFPYEGALEVSQGAFERWGVEVGDRVTVSH
jgi:uncharacterized protein